MQWFLVACKVTQRILPSSACVGLPAGYVSELLKEASIVAVDPCDELKEVVSLFGPFNGEVLEQTRFEWVSQQPHVT